MCDIWIQSSNSKEARNRDRLCATESVERLLVEWYGLPQYTWKTVKIFEKVLSVEALSA